MVFLKACPLMEISYKHVGDFITNHLTPILANCYLQLYVRLFPGSLRLVLIRSSIESYSYDQSINTIYSHPIA